MNTLLPNGNSESTEISKVILQGIYNKDEHTIFLTDILIWKELKLISYPAENRLIELINVLKRQPLLGEIVPLVNEVQFRIPQILECSKANIEKLYYGTYMELDELEFSIEYEKMINAAQKSLHLLKVRQEDVYNRSSTLILSYALAKDFSGQYYLKDGLAFVKKDGVYTLGQNEFILQWKDRLCSLNYDHLIERMPMMAHLYYSREKVLETHDGYIITKDTPILDKLKTDRIYIFSYDNIEIHTNNTKATLTNLTYIGPSSKTTWSSLSRMVFKVAAMKNLMRIEQILEEAKRQEVDFDFLKAN